MSAPANRRQDGTYSVELVRRAREHHAAGWRVFEIRRLLADEFGAAPHRGTIRCWVDPEYRQHRIATNGPAKRAHDAAHRKGPHRLSEPYRLERMRELRAERVSFRSIGRVSAVLWGVPLSENQVRRMLGATA